MDSFLVHSRRLVEFLATGRKRRRDDLRLSDFLDNPPPLDLTVGNQLWGDVSKRVAHLTFDPRQERASWPVEAMVNELRQAMHLAIEALLAVSPVVGRRLQRASRKGRPTYRKLMH
jgi:hypothetical protein